MIRLTRQTDYGIVLLSRLAAEPGSRTTRELSRVVRLPEAMTAKILKTLVRAGLLVSQRGAKGGYRLARAPEAVTVGEAIRALEGPIALTACSGPDHCVNELHCGVASNWQAINRAVSIALDSLTLADMARPLRHEGLVTISRRPAPAAAAPPSSPPMEGERT